MRLVHLPRILLVPLCLLVIAFVVFACDNGDDVTTTTEATTSTTLADTTTTSSTSPAPSTVEVPMVGFVTEADGIAIVEAEGLVADVVYMSAYPAEHGMVIIQDPEPGVIVTVGSTVVLTVGVDEDREPVPNVVGMTLAAATVALHDANDFYPVVTEQITPSSSNWGIVLDQSPAAGTGLTMGAPVNVTVGVAPTVAPSISLPEISLPGL